MAAKPPLPDGYELPAAVNGWTHAPESNMNGHIWTGTDEAAAVGAGPDVAVHVRLGGVGPAVDCRREFVAVGKRGFGRHHAPSPSPVDSASRSAVSSRRRANRARGTLTYW